MKNRRTAIMPYKPVYVSGNTLSIDVEDAKRLILFTGHRDKLAGHNEFQLDPRIQTNFGVGINDSAMPFGNEVGTVRLLNDVTDNVWLSRVNNADKLKVLPSGFLQANSHLTVDKTAHTITEEFIIKNEATSNSSTVIDSCDSTTGLTQGTGVFTSLVSENGKIKIVGHAADAYGLKIIKSNINLTGKQFLTFNFKCSIEKPMCVYLVQGANTLAWYGSRFTAPANTEFQFVLPLLAPAGSVGTNPSLKIGTIDFSAPVTLHIGSDSNGAETNDYNVYIDNITADVACPAYLEIHVPDSLADISSNIYIWTGSTYEWWANAKLDSEVAITGSDTTKLKYLDGTKLDDVYGAGNGRGLYRKGEKRQTVLGTAGNIVYSQTAGTKNRIGFRFDLPPSDNGRTDFNKIRLKLVTYYSSLGSTTYEFSQDTQLGTGINLMKKPYFCFYNPSKKIVDYYIVTKKPLGGQFSYDENGNIYNITFNLDPATKVYKGQLKHVNLTQDTNADKIPNFVDSSEIVSVEQLIGHLDFVYNYITKVDLTSSITTNDFGLTLDNCPTVYATSANNRVYANDVQLIPIGTAVTKDGVLNYFDVAGKSTIRIDEGQNCNAGECKLFDTVTSGNTDESTWKRVYRTDWVFTGDAVAENGLTRLRAFDKKLRQYVWNGAAWNIITGSTIFYPANYTSTNLVFSKITTDEIIFSTNVGDANFTSSTLNIKRGSYFLKNTFISTGLNRYYFLQPRFFYANGVLMDASLTDTVYPWIRNGTVTAISQDSSRLDIISHSKDISVYNFGSYYGAVDEQGSGTISSGAIPFDCTLLYTDSGTMTGGDTI